MSQSQSNKKRLLVWLEQNWLELSSDKSLPHQFHSRKFPCRPALNFSTYTVTPQYAKCDITSVITQKIQASFPFFLKLGKAFTSLKCLNHSASPSISAPSPLKATFHFSTFSLSKLAVLQTHLQAEEFFTLTPGWERSCCSLHQRAFQPPLPRLQSSPLTVHSCPDAAQPQAFRLDPFGWNFVPHMQHFSTMEFNQCLPLIS